jgi:hypothetical protein
MSATDRDTLANDLHRVANYVECVLGDFLTQLLAEQRHEAVSDLAFAGCRLIQTLRTIRDGREEGEVE